MSIDEIEQTPVDGLFERSDVATPADDTMQWRAALLQMVNWGGFDGLTVVPLRGDATMISGASGVGKSTILDAYTALMMPSDTKFNGASNDAVAGRARGAGQRNLLSYLRGAVDVVDDPRTGRPVEKLLRGKGADTWGAIAMTFVNDQGGRFTVLRTYYVPRRATRSGRRADAAGHPGRGAAARHARGRRARALPRQHAEEALPRHPGAPDVRRARRRPARAARHRRQRRRCEGPAAARPDPGGQPGPQRRRALQGHGARATLDLRRRRPRDRALRRPRHRPLRHAHRGAEARAPGADHRPPRPQGGGHPAARGARLLRRDARRRHPAADVAAPHPPPPDRVRRGRQPRRPCGGRRRARHDDLRGAHLPGRPRGRQGVAPRGRRVDAPVARAVAGAGAGRPRGPARAPGGPAGAAAAAHRRHRRPGARRRGRAAVERVVRRAADARPAVAGRLPAGAGADPARARRRAPRPVPAQPAPGRAAPRAGVAGEPRRPGAGPDGRAACRGRAGERDRASTSCPSWRSWSTSRPTRRGGARRSRPSSARAPG